MAVGHFNLGDYINARNLIHCILEEEPENRQATKFLAKIEKHATNDAYIGMALVGGVAAAAIGVAFTLFRGRNH